MRSGAIDRRSYSPKQTLQGHFKVLHVVQRVLMIFIEYLDLVQHPLDILRYALGAAKVIRYLCVFLILILNLVSIWCALRTGKRHQMVSSNILLHLSK